MRRGGFETRPSFFGKHYIYSTSFFYDLLHPPEVKGFLLDSPKGIRIYYIAFWRTLTLSLKERL
jgi:hypothetical protein